MSTNFSFNSRDPVYLQLIEYFRREIVANQLVAGQTLPSRREIARQFNINPNTVQRAFSEMEARTWISTPPNRPSQLTEDMDILNDIKTNFLHQTITDFVASIQTLDVDNETIINLVTKALHNGGEKDD